MIPDRISHASWRLTVLGASLLATGCGTESPQALGTLEWDRIVVPAPAAEPIVAIPVREGERVSAGQLLLQLDPARGSARVAAAEAQAERARQALAELVAGPRSERIEQAEATLAGAASRARNARREYQRIVELVERKLLARAELDRVRASRDSALAEAEAARAALATLLHGTRVEQLAQARAALRSAEAQAELARVVLDKLQLEAPRAGRVDALPYRLGDQAPVGAPLVVLLVGDAPYARVYVPEPIRAAVEAGDCAVVQVDDAREEDGVASFTGRVRSIRSEPSFTPYYALTGGDAARLSYLAEILLPESAASLPAGLPLAASFDCDNSAQSP